MPKKTKLSAKKPKRRKKSSYYAVVARFTIETAFVEFEASDDHERAERRAVKLANALPEGAWGATIFDEAPHVLCLLSEHDMAAVNSELRPGEQPGSPEAVLLDASEPYRYALLRADLDSGEGDVILQPWLVIDRPALMSSDIVDDWISDLQALDIDGMSRRVDELMSSATPELSDSLLFGPEKPPRRTGKGARKASNVVPFKRRQKPKKADDDGDPGAA